VKRNDETLLDFRNDLKHVNECENIVMDSLYNDMKTLQDEIAKVHETAKTQADELVKAGKTRPMSLADLKEQKTSVRHVAGVSLFNQVDFHTGRTPMERFTLSADASIKDAMKLSENVRDKFRKLLEYFGEDEKMASNDFFGVMKKFVIEFYSALDYVDKEEKARVRRSVD